MQWNKQSLQQLIDEYQAKYFNNKIQYPVELKLDRSLYIDDKEWGNAVFKRTKKHIIRLNAGLLNADYDLIESTLVHELIHCLQDEIDKTWPKTFKTDEGHNKFFNTWCKKLNDKYNFKYPLQRYVSAEEIKALEGTPNGMYYVYVEEYFNSFQPKLPQGFFIKFLYDVELRMLRRKGFKVKYYNQVIRRKTGTPVELNGDTTIKYNWLKNIDPSSDMTITDQAEVAGIDDYVYSGTWFNFNDGEAIVESMTVDDALLILERSGYNII